MLASTLRPVTTLLALLLPATLLVFATQCSETPAPVTPASPAAQLTSAPEDASSSWILPSVPLARRTVLLLRPPVLGPDASSIVAIAPDPPALREKGQWVYDLRYDKGDVYLVGVHPTQLPEARETPRAMGRFALEIYTGPTLLERVRFDFPGLGGGEDVASSGGRQVHGRPVSFTSKLRTRVGVMLPATARGTKLELWDRATNRRWPLPWPAVEMTTLPEDASASTGDGDAQP